jgi:sodium/potassium-transporting ATPase subunit beta
MVEEYRFDHEEERKGGIGRFIWNSDTREFCGRDGASWGKVSLFYAIFYACLGSFFVGMLAVFVSFMPRDKPSYYGEASTMNIRGLNPGLGFRPQIDVEDHQIVYNPIVQDDINLGRRKYFDNLKNFLDAKYGDLSSEEEANVIKCESGRSFDEELKNGKSCQFKHKEIFDGTDCTEDNSFGFKTHRPCILIKLNKIISWKPANDSVIIRCNGEVCLFFLYIIFFLLI